MEAAITNYQTFLKLIQQRAIDVGIGMARGGLPQVDAEHHAWTVLADAAQLRPGDLEGVEPAQAVHDFLAFQSHRCPENAGWLLTAARRLEEQGTVPLEEEERRELFLLLVETEAMGQAQVRAALGQLKEPPAAHVERVMTAARKVAAAGLPDRVEARSAAHQFISHWPELQRPITPSWIRKAFPAGDTSAKN